MEPENYLGEMTKHKKGREIMEKLFKLQENGTTVRTELLAGLTTFMTMAYIIALNPNLLTNFGAEFLPAPSCEKCLRLLLR